MSGFVVFKSVNTRKSYTDFFEPLYVCKKIGDSFDKKKHTMNKEELLNSGFLKLFKTGDESNTFLHERQTMPRKSEETNVQRNTSIQI